MTKSKLFVYGTLKRGYGNHHILEGSTYLGNYELEGSTLIDLGAYPGLIPAEDDVHDVVLGELYEIDDDLLPRLDRLEGVPWLYTRERTLDDIYYYQYARGTGTIIGSSWPVHPSR